MLWLFLFGVMIAVTVSAYSAYGASGALYIGGASLLAFVAGSGLRGSLYGSKGQLAGGAIAATFCMGIALWLSQEINVRAFGYEILGWFWVVGFFASCFLLTTKRFVDVG